uniref:Translocon-associated protein subunit gamma n=1 Tax=Neovison vison TaxID=452646 RepID=A0A8C7BKH0_NEOVI
RAISGYGGRGGGASGVYPAPPPRLESPVYHGSQRRLQAAVRGGFASAGFQPQPLGEVLRSLLRECLYRVRHPHLVAQKREDAVSKEVTRKLSEADNRKMSRKEKDERILWKKNEVADYEATTFSIFYNNTLFLVLVIVASFFILKNFNPTVNYILSISASSGLIALLSTGSK